MCDYFSFKLLPNGNVHWHIARDDNDNSHSGIEKLLGLPDNRTGTRRQHLSGECADGIFDKYEIHDSSNIPSWYSEHEAEYKRKVRRILKKVAPIVAKRAPLYADYKAKRDALYADYEAKRAPLDAELKDIEGYI